LIVLKEAVRSKKSSDLSTLTVTRAAQKVLNRNMATTAIADSGHCFHPVWLRSKLPPQPLMAIAVFMAKSDP
jgi:hypothetical protein